jgi:hypothetical protein
LHSKINKHLFDNIKRFHNFKEFFEALSLPLKVFLLRKRGPAVSLTLGR